MLHIILGIILGILKGIGIVLLVLVLLLLTLLLSVLFVPVRYRAEALKQEQEMSASLSGSWLLRAITVRLHMDAGKRTRTLEIRIFGFALSSIFVRLQRLRDWRRKRKAGKQKKRRKAAKKKHQSEQKREKKRSSGTTVPDKTKDTGTVRSEKHRAVEAEHPCTGSIQNEKEEKETAVSRFLRRTAQIPAAVSRWVDDGKKRIGKLRDFIHGIGKRVQNVRENVQRWIGRGKELLAFAEKYELKLLFFELKEELFGLLRHYRVRRADGRIHFGTGDPASTGELTGILYLLLPAKADIFIEPEFNEAVLELNVRIAGRIRGCHLVRTLWHLYRNSRLKRVIRKVRKKGDS